MVFTHQRSLTLLDSRFRFCPFGTTYLRRHEHRIHAKTKNLSIIASSKCRVPGTSGLHGHCMRHEAIRMLGGAIDGVFAENYPASQRGWQDNKAAGLRDFRFSIVIENVREDCWFTEKLLDAFLTGTVPIYWGCETLGEWFDLSGILAFNHTQDLSAIVAALDDALYRSLLPAIRHTFEVCDAQVPPRRVHTVGFEADFD